MTLFSSLPISTIPRNYSDVNTTITMISVMDVLPGIRTRRKLRTMTRQVTNILLTSSHRLTQLILHRPCPTQARRPYNNFLRLNLRLIRQSRVFISNLRRHTHKANLHLKQGFIRRRFIIPRLHNIIRSHTINQGSSVLRQLLSVKNVSGRFIRFVRMSRMVLIIIRTRHLFKSLQYRDIVDMERILQDRTRLFYDIYYRGQWGW